MDSESKDRVISELRTIVEKVEQKAQVAPDNPDVVALRRIVECANHRLPEIHSHPIMLRLPIGDVKRRHLFSGMNLYSHSDAIDNPLEILDRQIPLALGLRLFMPRHNQTNSSVR